MKLLLMRHKKRVPTINMKTFITIVFSFILFTTNAQIAYERGFEINCDTAETVFELLVCAQWTADSLHSKVLTLTKKIEEKSMDNITESHKQYLDKIHGLYGPPENKDQLDNALKRIDIAEKRITELEKIITSWQQGL